MCLPFNDLERRTLAKGEHAGFHWQVVQNYYGYRCGYVRVEPGHPWYGKKDVCYVDGCWEDTPHDCQRLKARMHGGCTFGEYGKACPTHGSEAEWWIGFDCAHLGDAPDPTLSSYHESWRGTDGVVRSQAYVEEQCRSLCEQAAAAAA